MRHMGNSGRIAIAATIAAAGLLVLTAITLEESVLFTFLGAVGIAYLACVVQVVARGRNLALLAGGVGTSLFIGFTIAFLRMWGLAFTADADPMGTAVTSQDSDIYFYLAAASGSATLLVLFAGAVWPSGKGLRSSSRNPASERKRSEPGRRPAAKLSSSRPARAASGPASASRAGAKRSPAAKRPASSSAGKPAGKPSSNAPVTRVPKSAPRPAVKPAVTPRPKPPAKAASRR